jgi:hypothetical protein
LENILVLKQQHKWGQETRVADLKLPTKNSPENWKTCSSEEEASKSNRLLGNCFHSQPALGLLILQTGETHHQLWDEVLDSYRGIGQKQERKEKK